MGSEANINKKNELQIHSTTSSINSELEKLLIQDYDNNKKDVEEDKANINKKNELQIHSTTSSINSGKLFIQDYDNNKKDIEENESNVNNTNESTSLDINDDFYYSEDNDSLNSNESNNQSTNIESNEESNGKEEYYYHDSYNDNEFLGKKRKKFN